MENRESEKVEYLQKQFGYAGIEGIPAEKIRELISQNENDRTLSHVMLFDKNGKVVGDGQEFEDKIELSLKCRADQEKDWIYFNSYDGAITLKDRENPVSVSANVSFGNTYKPDELVKMVKHESAIIRNFVNTKTNENYEGCVYPDFKNTDNEGNILFRRKTIDLDKIIRASMVEGKDNPFLRATLKDRFRRGESAEATIEQDGSKTTVMVKLMPQFNSLNYFDKESGKAIRTSPKKAAEQSVTNGQVTKQAKSEGATRKESNRKKTQQNSAGMSM